MHTLARNERSFFYATYLGKTKKYDTDGNYTGQSEVIYSDPVEIKANISPSLGRAELESFGITSGYTHTIVTDDMECPINEYSILWYGIPVTSPHNFVVVRKAEALNHIIYALQEVSSNVTSQVEGN